MRDLKLFSRSYRFWEKEKTKNILSKKKNLGFYVPFFTAMLLKERENISKKESKNKK